MEHTAREEGGQRCDVNMVCECQERTSGGGAAAAGEGRQCGLQGRTGREGGRGEESLAVESNKADTRHVVWQGNTVLHLGAGWGNVKVVALLLEVRTRSRLSV